MAEVNTKALRGKVLAALATLARASYHCDNAPDYFVVVVAARNAHDLLCHEHDRLRSVYRDCEAECKDLRTKNDRHLRTQRAMVEESAALYRLLPSVEKIVNGNTEDECLQGIRSLKAAYLEITRDVHKKVNESEPAP